MVMHSIDMSLRVCVFAPRQYFTLETVGVNVHVS